MQSTELSSSEPLDFSKTNLSNSSSVKSNQLKKQVQRLNSMKQFKKQHDYHLNNSENSDENISRSSSSSPDSLINEQAQLNLQLNSTTTGQLNDELLMHFALNPHFLFNKTAAKLNLDANNLNESTTFPASTNNLIETNQSAQFLLGQNMKNNNVAMAAASAMSNLISHPQPINHLNQLSQFNQINQQFNQFNQLNQTKSNQMNKSTSKQSNSKAVSRKSMLLAKQRQDEQLKQQQQSFSNKFGILGNSQNSNLPQIDKDSNGSPMLLNSSLQTSISSNLSGEENNSLFDDIYFNESDGSPGSRRRRGQPIPDAQKDDSYWVRRRKNNEAAKKSRDAKRAKDLLTAKRAVLLETENSTLKEELTKIKNENLILRSILGEEIFFENDHKQLIENIISNGHKVNADKVRKFAEEFNRIYGLTNVENMES